MAYYPLQLDPGTPDVVEDFIRHSVEAYFHDVHCMLRLPLPSRGLRAGCNYSIANVLLAVASGASDVLYNKARRNRDQFLGLLVDHYPWADDPPQGVSPEEAAEALYDTFRNPLTHAFGLRRKEKGFQAKVGKVGARTRSGMITGNTARGIKLLERSSKRPRKPSVVVTPKKNVLWVGTFYWGLRKMIEQMTTKPELMAYAEKRLLTTYGHP